MRGAADVDVIDMNGDVLRIRRETDASARAFAFEARHAGADLRGDIFRHAAEERLVLIIIETMDVERRLADIVEADVRRVQFGFDDHVGIDFFIGFRHGEVPLWRGNMMA